MSRLSISKLAALIGLSLQLLSVLYKVDAAAPPAWLMRCNPYTTDSGRQAVGAFGPCQNACFAANTGQQPGTLTIRNDRDQDAGCSRTPCSNNKTPYAQYGDSCDEYPMATTERGPNYWRTLRCVKGSENSSQGAQLRNFKNKNGLGAGDQFRMGVAWDRSNPPPFCADIHKQNDGSEFKYVDRQFVNARSHARDLTVEDGKFETITTMNHLVQNFTYLLLSNGDIASIIGRFNDSALEGGVWADGIDALTVLREVPFEELIGMVENVQSEAAHLS